MLSEFACTYQTNRRVFLPLFFFVLLNVMFLLNPAYLNSPKNNNNRKYSAQRGKGLYYKSCVLKCKQLNPVPCGVGRTALTDYACWVLNLFCYCAAIKTQTHTHTRWKCAHWGSDITIALSAVRKCVTARRTLIKELCLSDPKASARSFPSHFRRAGRTQAQRAACTSRVADTESQPFTPGLSPRH